MSQDQPIQPRQPNKHTPSDSSSIHFVAPSIQRRLICMLYEAFLLGAVILAAAALFDVATDSRHALTLRHARGLWLFFVIGAYFVYFWRRTGQTLAMKTWRIKLIDNERAKLPLTKAVVRYLMAWLWFLPGLALASQIDTSIPYKIAIIAIAFLVWTLTALLDPQRQFLHDRIVSTRLVVDNINKN